jgi:hypothetical protein
MQKIKGLPARWPREQLLRCAPRDVGGCRPSDTECGRWPFRSERAPGAERWNG